TVAWSRAGVPAPVGEQPEIRGPHPGPGAVRRVIAPHEPAAPTTAGAGSRELLTASAPAGSASGAARSAGAGGALDARGGEAQARHPPPDAGQALEQGPGPVGHQVVVQGQNGGTGVDADHVAGRPAAVEVNAAEAVAPQERSFLPRLMEVAQHAF